MEGNNNAELCNLLAKENLLCSFLNSAKLKKRGRLAVCRIKTVCLKLLLSIIVVRNVDRDGSLCLEMIKLLQVSRKTKDSEAPELCNTKCIAARVLCVGATGFKN